MRKWNPPVAGQLREFVAGVREILAGNLTGVYLHGSLAMGCFNPRSSDIDLLVVVRRRIAAAAAIELANLVLSLSGKSHLIEVTFISRRFLRPWRYPTSFDLHYSESWRARFESNPSKTIAAQESMADPDLAAHITILRRRGIRLAGEAIGKVFPEVPKRDYLDSIMRDLRWAMRRVAHNPTYLVLNACRVHAFISEHRVMSKAEAGRFAVRCIAPEYRDVVRRALNDYRGSGASDPRVLSSVRSFAKYMMREIDGERRKARIDVHHRAPVA